MSLQFAPSYILLYLSHSNVTGLKQLATQLCRCPVMRFDLTSYLMAHSHSKNWSEMYICKVTYHNITPTYVHKARFALLVDNYTPSEHQAYGIF